MIFCKKKHFVGYLFPITFLSLAYHFGAMSVFFVETCVLITVFFVPLQTYTHNTQI